jgi:Tfp pilus assembly protein PilE
VTENKQTTEAKALGLTEQQYIDLSALFMIVIIVYIVGSILVSAVSGAYSYFVTRAALKKAKKEMKELMLRIQQDLGREKILTPTKQGETHEKN